jgi:hypothetical protein
MDIWTILQSLSIFYGHLVHFVVIWYVFQFWYFVPRKIWQPCLVQCHFEHSLLKTYVPHVIQKYFLAGYFIYHFNISNEN